MDNFFYSPAFDALRGTAIYWLPGFALALALIWMICTPKKPKKKTPRELTSADIAEAIRRATVKTGERWGR
jgi:hypothetical protein